VLYFPPSKGAFETRNHKIVFKEANETEHFTERKLALVPNCPAPGLPAELLVEHVHFKSWKDYSVPENESMD